ncbi:hypothetical protein [Consotaella aegiceratis]|uniref:hypothetical protein n=1 Tax=Consotaella aegiceratis TaxID=3097961 RepID=UPI002F3EFC55
MSDEPIEEPDFVGGVKVVDIGDIRVARGLTRRPASSCKHHRVNYDSRERRIWCKDCERDVDAFDAFLLLVEYFDREKARLDSREQRLKEAEAFQARSIAAKEIDKAWRSRTMVPCCPACGQGLFPEDFKSGVAMLGRDYAEARRKRRLEGK